MGYAFAEALRDRISVGHARIKTTDAADIWDEVVPSRHGLDWNTKFRWIKNAVDNKHISGSPLNEHGGANKSTYVGIADQEAFFRRKGWKTLATAKEPVCGARSSQKRLRSTGSCGYFFGRQCVLC